MKGPCQRGDVDQRGDAARSIVTVGPTTETETARPSGRRASERVGAGLAAFPVDGSVSVDGFAEGDLKAGRNDLANGEAQGNPIAEAGECRVRRRRAGFRVRF